jgi:polyphosphate kinase 2 (PPK2 family)
MDREDDELQKYALQIELLKFQDWSQETGAKHVILFEGRDAAGKGGTIKRFMQHLNPRVARVVALTKPTETERGQWYFHRYVTHLPTAGEIVLFDRSWYNRAGVEKVMDYCTSEEYSQFLRHAPLFEEMLVESGFSLTKHPRAAGGRRSAPPRPPAKDVRRGCALVAALRAGLRLS